MDGTRVGDSDGDFVKTLEKRAFEAFGQGQGREHPQNVASFNELVNGVKTLPLVRALTILIKPGRLPDPVRSELMKVLTGIPKRPGGVRDILEFVFAVHPSTTVKKSEVAAPQKTGANITMEALKMASNILSTPPADTQPEDWFKAISGQLIELLDGEGDRDLVKVAAYVIGFGILGRRTFGAPGAPGWRYFAYPMLSKIHPTLYTTSGNKVSLGTNNNILQHQRPPLRTAAVESKYILVEADELSTALRRLSSLISSHPNPGLSSRLLHGILPQLWVLSSWPEQDGDIADQYCRPAGSLLKTALKLSKTIDDLYNLTAKILHKGQVKDNTDQWVFDRSSNGGIQVRLLPRSHRGEGVKFDIGQLESKVNAFVELLKALNSDTERSAIFLLLLKDMLDRQQEAARILLQADDHQEEDPEVALIRAKLLQRMMEVMPDQLVSNSDQLLELVSRILWSSEKASANDDTTALALSLLNLVVTAPSFKKPDIETTVLSSIQSSLRRISAAWNSDVSQTAHNISLLLTYRDALDDPSEPLSAPTERQVEDRRTYNLAIQLITEPDTPAPVRSEGLNLLSSLILAESPILDIPTVLALLSSLLNDDEDYTNLRVIKLFTQLAGRHPKSVTKELLEHYVDVDDKEKIDTRLRFGEALLQVIQTLGETFTGDAATTVCENLLATAGRRGYRSKTEKQQEREARVQARRHKEASDAWGGEVPDLGDDDARSAEERAREEAIAQIVGGWESKRGSEDVRVRASALSIFAAALETNVAGVGPTLAEASVDLCLDILTLEGSPEAGILRRSAVASVLSFVRALADARERGRRLGFGLTDPSRGDIARVLRFVEQTDNDGLVQHNAREAAESLENWTLTTLLPEATGDDGPGSTLTRLAGLDLSAPSLPPLQQEGSQPGSNGRPLIEEIE